MILDKVQSSLNLESLECYFHRYFQILLRPKAAYLVGQIQAAVIKYIGHYQNQTYDTLYNNHLRNVIVHCNVYSLYNMVQHFVM